MTLAAVNPSAIAASSKIIQIASDHRLALPDGPAVVTRADRTGAGSASRCLRSAGARSPLLIRGGSVAASDGEPAQGGLGPTELGTESQYWLSALSAGFAQPGTAAAAALAGARHTHSTTGTMFLRRLTAGP